MKSHPEVQNAINAIRRDLNEAIGKRDLLNGRIMQLEKNLRSLRSLLAGDRVLGARERKQQLAVGLTEAIRTVMRDFGSPMTASAIRLLLTKKGFDLERFSNPSAAVVNTLVRMHRSGELNFDPTTRGYTFGLSTEEMALLPDSAEFATGQFAHLDLLTSDGRRKK
jgi:hypothetical protein